ncbi:MAG TPA: SPOR domain-containing protein [Gammaproteobacteria bacterium]|nr:SPOR domain-containing protein [Gammaproteobacteria bacterium]
MAAVESKLKQRIVGALVLIALAVIFLPMLLKKEDPVREIVVQAPQMPATPAAPQFSVEEVPVPVPEPEAEDVWDEPLITEQPAQAASAPTAPIEAPEVQPTPTQTKPVVKTEPSKTIATKPQQPPVAAGIDKNNLPVSWSVQLASMASKTNADTLRDTYRKKQYNAYVRSADGVHKVLIGPLIKQAEAQAMCKNLKSREGQECFVVRYQP